MREQNLQSPQESYTLRIPKPLTHLSRSERRLWIEEPQKRSILRADYFLAFTSMNDYAIGRFSRRCRVLDRPLEPGERFYSVAVTKGGEIVRYDISESEWKGPPTEAIGWWRGTMDTPKPQRIVPTPNSQLLEKLGQLSNDPNQRSLAHLLGLLLVRRKVLQQELDDSSVLDNSPTHQSLVHPTTEQKFIVPIAEPELASLKDIQEALQALLYTEG